MKFRSDSRVVLTLVSVLSAPAALHAELSCAPVNLLGDGGFETHDTSNGSLTLP